MPTLQETLTYQPNELAFGTSGLRGLVSDMTDLECYINTVGFLQFLHHADHLRPGQAVYIAGDLRHSTPRILKAVMKAIEDSGQTPVYCGLIPTPAIAYYGLERQAPSIMVTGSHIPDDRNGIKFNKTDGEVLKEDELGIKESVAIVRAQLYKSAADVCNFKPDGSFKVATGELPTEDTSASELYSKRFQDVFESNTFAGKKIIFYQHSAVGRDLLVTLLESLGAEVIPVGKTENFTPIDTENVTPKDQAYFKSLAAQYPDAFAIVSTDGDSDRPFVIDENGIFHRGDVLGALVADWIGADFAAFPVSASDAADKYLTRKNIQWQHTRIGSPYVISVMDEAIVAGNKRVVGWEVNGGFMLGGDIEINSKPLKALPTRDAFFPIAAALALAIQKNQKVSDLFATLPQRATQAGLINDFPPGISRAILEKFAQNTPETRTELASYFNPNNGFTDISSLNSLDGIRIYFTNGEIAHLRPSGNAPQLRIYSVADTQERADEIVSLAIAEPDGIFRQLEQKIQKEG
jgi:phosphomannomutase